MENENIYKRKLLEGLKKADGGIVGFLSGKFIKFITSIGLSYILVISIIQMVGSQYFLVLDWGSLIKLYSIIFGIGLVISLFMDTIVDLIILLFKKIK